jgi:hypothetical protein
MKSCGACGLTESQALADAKALGMVEEFTSGLYTCCQIALWAEEQWWAWLEASHEDSQLTPGSIERIEQAEKEPALVPVRFRRPAPWFRRP